MSLSEAVLEVASVMQDDAEVFSESGEAEAARKLRSYAQQLRIAVKASEGQPTVSPMAGMLLGDTGASQHREMIDKARAEFRSQKAEEASERMLELHGGPGDDSLISVSADMPTGAYTLVAGARYQLRTENGRAWLQFAPADDSVPTAILAMET